MRRVSVTAIFCSQLLWPIAASAIVSQIVPIDGAEQIEINVPIALHVEQGDHKSLTLGTSDRDMKELRVRQQGNLLSTDRLSAIACTSRATRKCRQRWSSGN